MTDPLAATTTGSSPPSAHDPLAATSAHGDWSPQAFMGSTNVDPTGKKSLSRIGDLLQRSGQAGMATVTRGPKSGLSVLVHGEPQSQYNTDTATLRKRIPGAQALYDWNPTLPKTGIAPLDTIDQALGNWSNSAARTLEDTALQTAVDPTTYVGGSGALEKAGAELGPRVAAQVAKRTSEEAYAALVHKGAAVRGIYKVLPPKKAQQVIASLEQASRKLSNDDIELLVNKRYSVDAINQGKMYAALGLKRSEKAAVEPYLDQYFERELEAQPGQVGRAVGQLGETAKAVQAVTNIPYFFNPTRHMANIASLAALHDPVGAAQAIGRKIGAGFSADIKRANAEMIARGQERGLTSTAPERELPTWMQKAGPASKVYNWSQQTLWGFDDLTRDVLIQREQKRLIAQGMRPNTAEAMAAHNVNRALVDYTMRSPATKGLYYVAPFATFRTKIPGAVVRSVMKHPERAAIADRLTGGMATGGTQGPPGANQAKSYLPAAEVFRALSSAKGADEYLRSSLSWPAKDVLSAFNVPAPLQTLRGQLRPGQGQHFWTYGSPIIGKLGPGTPRRKRGILPSQVLGAFPGSDQILSRLGLSPFEPSSFSNELLQQIGSRL